MLIIHAQGGVHPPGGIPHPRTGRSGTVYSFYPYLPDSEPLAVVRDAIELIRVRNARPGVAQAADTTFRRIRGVSFTELFTGGTQVTIFRSPTHLVSGFGCTSRVGGRHITLTRNCWGIANRDTAVRRTAATIVHELAHCAGAAGGDSAVAEWSLRACGFADMYSPSVWG
jgi:hypothetical protein